MAEISDIIAKEEDQGQNVVLRSPEGTIDTGPGEATITVPLAGSTVENGGPVAGRDYELIFREAGALRGIERMSYEHDARSHIFNKGNEASRSGQRGA